jgi:polysaccharide pyruvyl transferase WcaK-like protein
LALTRINGSYAIGVGVEDPVFIGRNSGSEKGELKRWLPILSEFRTVSVRGPRSAELLSDIGLNVEVSGDPALLLPRPDVAPEDGLIGVNLGFGDDDLWGQDPAKVSEEMSAAIRQLSAQGYRFVGILMNRDDRRWTELALNGTGADIVHPADASAAAHELARCSVAIVSRLHAGILASLSDTPAVALEYLPKCRDFALSIDDERSLLRTDTLSSTAVVDRVLGALADAPNIRIKTHAAVARLRQRLQADYAALGRHLGLNGEMTHTDRTEPR